MSADGGHAQTADHSPASGATAGPPASEAPSTVRGVLGTPGYPRLLLLTVLIGIPISLFAFGFVSLEHELQHWVWETWPTSLGWSRAPWWWPLPALALAGLLAAPIITRLPGAGGHIPVYGLGGGGPVLPAHLPSVILAALACLPLGVVLGPEAPLMAIGSGLALFLLPAGARARNPRGAALLGNAGSSAAIATIFGSPIVVGVMLMEGAGLGGTTLLAVLIPCLLASGVGALVFTGFGHWTGLGIGALTLPSVPHAGTPDAGDFLWGLPMAVLVCFVAQAGRGLGHACVAWVAGRPAVRIVVCAVGVGVFIAAYALITGRDPEEAALSGQNMLAQLSAHPAGYAVGTLIVLALCKTIAWGIALGSLRGGPIFPAVMIGAAIGIACSGLPGFGTAPGLAAGIVAASTSVTRLPITSIVLAASLLGGQAANLMPLMILAAAASWFTLALTERRVP